MDKSTARMRFRAVMVGGALALSMALPIAVSADTTESTIPSAASNGATITGGSLHFDSKLIVTATITFVCDPLSVYDWETGITTITTDGRLGSASAYVVQASGKSVSSASGSVFGGAVVCDGTSSNTRSIPVVASTSPWKSGAAAAGATVYITAGNEEDDSDYGSTGPMAVKIGK